MPTVTAILLTVLPLFLLAAVAAGIRERPERSLGADRFTRQSGSALIPFVLLIAIGFAIAAQHANRPNWLAAGITSAALLGSLLIERKFQRTVQFVTRYYLDPQAWDWPRPCGDRWRYQMQQRFVADPEYLDSMMITMFKTYKTRHAFEAALAAEVFPEEYEPFLRKRFWGILFPSLKSTAQDSVPNTILRSNGPFRPQRNPDQIYEELRALALTSDALFLDRWQYYWGLRNINAVDTILNRLFSVWTQLGVVALGICIYLLGAHLHPSADSELSKQLAAIASGAILWMLAACGASSLLIVGAFRGTGTFRIAYPCEGEAFDPLWALVIQLGIAAFTVSFVIFGLATPFLFEPNILEKFEIDVSFVAYAVGSLIFCASVFASHVAGVHKLMARSRENALSRLRFRLITAGDPTEHSGLLQHFEDVRALHTWPIRGSVVAQTGAGILLPILVQAILVYTGLRAK